jgi:arabinofuranosyltransferase
MILKNLPKYIYVFSLLFSIAVLFYFPKWIVDDAFITFRYAENLVKHGTLIFNTNDTAVEGYTGFVLPVLIAIGIKLGISPVFFSHMLGILSYFLGVVFLFLLLRSLEIKDYTISLIILLYTTTPILYTHIFSGLETILFLSSIILTIYLTHLILIVKNIRYFLLFALSLSFLFLSLIRPEGILLSIILAVFLDLYYYYKNRKELRKILLFQFLFFLIPFAIYFLWRWDYYGQLLPNTYYLKSGNFKFNSSSYYSFIKFITSVYTFPFLISVILIMLNVDNVWKEIKERGNEIFSKQFLIIFLSLFIFSLVIIVRYLYSDLLMDYSHRFFIPLIPICVLFIIKLFDLGFSNLKGISISNPLTSKVYILIAFVIVYFYFNSIIPKMKEEVEKASKMGQLLEDVHIKSGKFISTNFSKDNLLLVHADAGAIPYYSGLKTIDFGGLNDIYLSHRNELSNKEIVDYFFYVNADVLAITSFYKYKLERRKGSLNWDTLNMILKDERFKQYKLIKIFETSVWSYYEFIFVKKNLFDKTKFKEISDINFIKY